MAFSALFWCLQNNTFYSIMDGKPRDTKMKKFLLALFITASISASAIPGPQEKIAVQNSILAKVEGKTISMMDVKKKMDYFFFQHYPNLADNEQARLQFYEMSWRQVLMEMIDHELILADAEEKQVKLTDGEIREQMEERFGPHVMKNLDQIGLTHDEAWKMMRDEMIVQRMNWWFAHSKAVQSVTPQDIRQAYRFYLKDHPSFSEWKYQVVSIRAEKADETLANQVYALLSSKNSKPEDIAAELKALEKPGVKIQISPEYIAKDIELSEAHKAALASLEPNHYSKPSLQTGRDKKIVYRCFYLAEKTEHPAAAFETLSAQLKNNLVQKAVAKESKNYLEKLRNRYGYDTASLNKSLPEDFHPFSIQ
jgi:hypothetical protein